MGEEDTKAIILFDGVCNLCSAAVQLVIRRDPGAYFRFASLQSDAGAALLKQYGLPHKATPESIVLIEGGKVYQYSDAALRIARKLKGIFRLLYGFMIVPRFIRDPVYKLIARNRYRVWGRQDNCWLPAPALQDRFL
jgi:predicted DCC family thiol-disulfide oxidoreductase YuxK